LIEVANVSKSFGRTKVLQDVSFSIGNGEVAGYVGLNGAADLLPALKSGEVWGYILPCSPLGRASGPLPLSPVGDSGLWITFIDHRPLRGLKHSCGRHSTGYVYILSALLEACLPHTLSIITIRQILGTPVYKYSSPP